MQEEVESHALYELSATLARSTGSRKLPKLKPLLSNASGLALPRQQTMQLLQTLSGAAPALQKEQAPPYPALPVLRSMSILDAQPNLGSNAAKPATCMQKTVSYESNTSKNADFLPGKNHAHVKEQYVSSSLESAEVLSREAMLLFGSSRYPPVSEHRQPALHDQPKPAKDKALSKLMEAVLYEEKYHRAGREVLGQRIDVKAEALQQAEHSKQRRRKQIQKLGYVPLVALHAS